jgi:diguanylate cyclase (GGDEF)-like protein
VLCRVARAISQSVRTADLCFRIGGDEFAILLPETSSQDAWSVLDRVQRAVDGLNAGISISVGLDSSLRFERTADLQISADSNLYEAKDTRKKSARQ